MLVSSFIHRTYVEKVIWKNKWTLPRLAQEWYGQQRFERSYYAFGWLWSFGRQRKLFQNRLPCSISLLTVSQVETFKGCWIGVYWEIQSTLVRPETIYSHLTSPLVHITWSISMSHTSHPTELGYVRCDSANTERFSHVFFLISHFTCFPW